MTEPVRDKFYYLNLIKLHHDAGAELTRKEVDDELHLIREQCWKLADAPGADTEALEAAWTELSSQVRARLQPGARSFAASVPEESAQDTIASGAGSASIGTTPSGKKYPRLDDESAESLNTPDSSGM
jgi:hypothetical protein